MSVTRQIRFALVATAKGMHFDRYRPEGVKFYFAENDDHFLALVPQNPTEDPTGLRSGLACKVFASLPATAEQVSFVRAYNERNLMLRLSNEITLPYCNRDREVIDKDGFFKDDFHPRRYFCPKDISDLIEAAEMRLGQNMIRFLKLLRWRQGADASKKTVESATLYWTVCGSEYPLAPLHGGGPADYIEIGGSRIGVRWSESDVAGLRELWSNERTVEPLAHELVREAGQLVDESPRSAVLIATAALETGVKVHIGRIAPDTRWLMKEVPSPPLFKILRDYVPLIHSKRGNSIDFWEKLRPSIKKVQKLAEVRNIVAHTGDIPELGFSIPEAIQLVSDLLYVLDVLEGSEWAKKRLSDPTREMLGWPAPNHYRLKPIRLQLM